MSRDYSLIFEKLSDLQAGTDDERECESAERADLDDIEELRRFAAGLAEPDPVYLTTT